MGNKNINFDRRWAFKLGELKKLKTCLGCKAKFKNPIINDKNGLAMDFLVHCFTTHGLPPEYTHNAVNKLLRKWAKGVKIWNIN